MERLTTASVALVLALFISASLGFGQTPTGGVNGVVTDSTGAAIPSATLTLTNPATGIVTTAVTNASGVYAFVNVAPSLYSLKAEKSGFRASSVAAFRVAVNGTVTLNMTLSVGQVSETVQVLGEAPLLQASTSELGTVIGTVTVFCPASMRFKNSVLIHTMLKVNMAWSWAARSISRRSPGPTRFTDRRSSTCATRFSTHGILLPI